MSESAGGLSHAGLNEDKSLCSGCSMDSLPACTSPPGCPLQAGRPRCWFGLTTPHLPSYEESEVVVVGFTETVIEIKNKRKIKSSLKRPDRKLRWRTGGTAAPRTAPPSYLSDIGAFGFSGPRDDARHGKTRLAGVDEVGRVHLASQRLDVAQDGHLHLQVGRLRLIHDETHQDVELLLIRKRLSAERWRKIAD